ncbi:MAG: hypothetical protein HKN91_00290 [Acidimicrobiia bacterium]|nr:hypothetical protein [Acidimicrobiia bacterium]
MSEAVTKQADEVKLIVLACEAGMGSSLMAANQLKKMAKKAKLDVTVIHSAVHAIPDAADVILTHSGLAKQVKTKAPHAAIVPFTMFFNDPKFKSVISRLQAGESITSEI